MQRLYWREDWNARAPRAITRQAAPTEAFLHYSDDPQPELFDHLDEQKAHMRQLQNFHMDVRQWSDIAYHWIVFQPYGGVPGARAFRGRRPNWVPAAQLLHNTGTLAICIVGGPGDALKDDTEDLIVQLLGRYRNLRTLGGHRDVTPTSCPGDDIYRRIPALAKRAGLRVYR